MRNSRKLTHLDDRWPWAENRAKERRKSATKDVERRREVRRGGGWK
jgi:hypothetical protein